MDNDLWALGFRICLLIAALVAVGTLIVGIAIGLLL